MLALLTLWLALLCMVSPTSNIQHQKSNNSMTVEPSVGPILPGMGLTILLIEVTNHHRYLSTPSSVRALHNGSPVKHTLPSTWRGSQSIHGRGWGLKWANRTTLYSLFTDWDTEEDHKKNATHLMWWEFQTGKTHLQRLQMGCTHEALYDPMHDRFLCMVVARQRDFTCSQLQSQDMATGVVTTLVDIYEVIMSGDPRFAHVKAKIEGWRHNPHQKGVPKSCHFNSLCARTGVVAFLARDLGAIFEFSLEGSGPPASRLSAFTFPDEGTAYWRNPSWLDHPHGLVCLPARNEYIVFDNREYYEGYWWNRTSSVVRLQTDATDGLLVEMARIHFRPGRQSCGGYGLLLPGNLVLGTHGSHCSAIQGVIKHHQKAKWPNIMLSISNWTEAYPAAEHGALALWHAELPGWAYSATAVFDQPGLRAAQYSPSNGLLLLHVWASYPTDFLSMGTITVIQGRQVTNTLVDILQAFGVSSIWVPCQKFPARIWLTHEDTSATLLLSQQDADRITHV